VPSIDELFNGGHCVRHDAVAALFVGSSVRGGNRARAIRSHQNNAPFEPGRPVLRLRRAHQAFRLGGLFARHIIGVTSAMLLMQPSIHDLCTRDSATTCVARHHSSRADSAGACTSLSLSLIEANIPLFIAQTAAWVRLLTRILRRIALT
jgi:hypothetical protein